MTDFMSELRAYARGYLAGECSANFDEFLAYRLEALALVVLRELGASQAGAQDVLEQARHDAHMAVPDLTEFAARVIAAEMIVFALRKRLAQHESEIAA